MLSFHIIYTMLSAAAFVGTRRAWRGPPRGAHGRDAVLGQQRAGGRQRRRRLLQHVAPAGHAMLQLRGGHRRAERRRQRPRRAHHQRHLARRAVRLGLDLTLTFPMTSGTWPAAPRPTSKHLEAPYTIADGIHGSAFLLAPVHGLHVMIGAIIC